MDNYGHYYDEEVKKQERLRTARDAMLILRDASECRFGSSTEEREIALKKIEGKLKELSGKMDSLDDKALQEKFGGEFTTYALGDYSSLIDGHNSYRSKNEKIDIPLFLFLDILNVYLYEIFLNYQYATDNLKEHTKSVISQVQELREKLAKLDYDKRFDPNKRISENAGKRLARANSFDFNYSSENGVDYVSLEATTVYEYGHWSYGDYRHERSDSVYSSDAMYLEDEKALTDARRRAYDEETKRKNDRLMDVVTRFYEDGNIPPYKKAIEILTEKGVPKNVIDAVTMLSIYNSEVQGTRQELCRHEMIEYTLERIEEEVKRSIREQKELEKQQEMQKNAVAAAKRRFQEKNPLWRFMHRKISPKNMELETMTTEELNNLYVEEEKKGKGTKR